jgi:putative addiction module component (TIGR02574 family)
MDIYTDTIRNLAPAEKLRLVERIWDDLAAEDAPIPLPEWAVAEANRRRDEMLADPNLGLTHDEVWKRINDTRNG